MTCMRGKGKPLSINFLAIRFYGQDGFCLKNIPLFTHIFCYRDDKLKKEQRRNSCDVFLSFKSILRWTFKS